MSTPDLEPRREQVHVQDLIGSKTPIVNIWAFGASTEEADNSTAIQAAIDAAENEQGGNDDRGGIVWVPRGVYPIASALEPKPYVTVMGLPGRSVIEATTQDMAVFDGSGISSNNLEGFDLWGIKFDVDSVSGVSAISMGSKGLAHCRWDNCNFSAALAYGINAYSLGNCRIHRCWFGKSGGVNGSHQCVLIEGIQSKVTWTTVFSQCYFNGAQGCEAAVDIEWGNTIKFDSCTWEYLEARALRLRAVTGAVMDNCNFEGLEVYNVAHDGIASPSGAIQIKRDDGATRGTSLSIRGIQVQNNGSTHPWTHIVDVGAASYVAELKRVVGNMSGAYLTKTSTTYDDPAGLRVVENIDANNCASDLSYYLQATYSQSVAATRYATTTLSDTGPTDDLNVTNVGVVLVDTNANNVTLGGLTGGEAGQVLEIVVVDAGNNTIIEHAEATGNQDIYLAGGADLTLTAAYGGVRLVCNGTHWYEVGH